MIPSPSSLPSPDARRRSNLGLASIRKGIDQVDNAIVLLAGLRRRLVRAAMHHKERTGAPVRDPERETAVLARGRRVARRVALPRDTAETLLHVLMLEARMQQDRTRQALVAVHPHAPTPRIDMNASPLSNRWLRLLPPPHRLRPVLARLPRAAHAPLAERMLTRTLACMRPGTLDLVAGRRLGIEVEDLGLSWVFTWDDGHLQATDDAAEATVRGTATDLALLASRLEDADTLFFQRRLRLTGDVELGLTVRNLLDRLPWEALPLGLRIVLQRGSRLLRDARDAYHHRT